MEEKLKSLQKTSTNDDIKKYFQKVFELKSIGKEFPVNFDMVWQLVYARKEEAVRSLKDTFIEDIDYQFLRKNAENPLGFIPICL